MFFQVDAFSQKIYTLNGSVLDRQTGETLIGATIKLIGTKQIGTSTNSYGYYSLSVPQGDYEISVSYIGYNSVLRKINLNSNQKLDFQLEVSNQLNEVIVSAEKSNNNITNPQMGVEKLDVKDIKNIPVLFGERDILKTLQLLPGIKAAGEGNSGF